jgi:hypothetical protein
MSSFVIKVELPDARAARFSFVRQPTRLLLASPRRAVLRGA